MPPPTLMTILVSTNINIGVYNNLLLFVLMESEGDGDADATSHCNDSLRDWLSPST